MTTRSLSLAIQARAQLGTWLNLPEGTYLITEEGYFMVEEGETDNFIIEEI